MIEVENFFKFLKKNKIEFFSGVPDSILKDTKSIFNKMPKRNHVLASNEGIATSICIGHHLSTGELPCVYLQNSGLGNAVNPLISIAHKKVYSIPLLLLIGWRGAPGQKDEPQHELKGKITTKLLKNLDIKYCALDDNKSLKKLKKLINFSKKNNTVVACLVKKNIFFSKKTNSNKQILKNKITRENFIKILLEHITKTTKIISTTGFTSRELNQIRQNYHKKKGKDFYMVGGMGHASSVALGLSISNKNQIICLDGDGSFMMHLGSIFNIGFYSKKNFKHIVLNNNSHESVGGQISNFDNIKLKNISFGAGYKRYFYLDKVSKIKSVLKKFLVKNGPSILEVKINQSSIKNLSRPKNLIQQKKIFMR